jgi:hypothetical protein
MINRQSTDLSAVTAASPEAAGSRRSRRTEILILTARVNFNP